MLKVRVVQYSFQSAIKEDKSMLEYALQRNANERKIILEMSPLLARISLQAITITSEYEILCLGVSNRRAVQYVRNIVQQAIIKGGIGAQSGIREAK